MCACTAASVEDAANNLLEELNSGAKCLCVEHDASDDVAPALLRAARARVEAGSNVRVVCADAVAAARFRALAADDPLLSALDVVSARELALSILGDAQVGDAVGRDARVLDENELAVLMEDVKVSGLKPGRLREMLKFFYKSISDCADDDERWLITAEEQTVHAILTENLEARRALLPCEVSSLAYRGLVKAGVEREPLTLVADDFGSLSKASQRLVRHLATDGLVAAGRTLASSSSEEPYPCFDGFRALADEADCLVTLACERPAAARESRALDDPAAEFAFAAASVEECLADGFRPGDVAVAVPNAAWGERIAAELEGRGIAVERGFDGGKIKGDPRTEGRYADLKQPVEDVARDAVHVVSYARCHGRHVRTVFVTGLVNGFLPANDAVDDKFTIDHRRVALERERALFLDVLSCASERAVCTRFVRDLLENTAFTKVQTSRVFVRDGERFARVTPSEFASLTDEVLSPAPDAPRELPTKVLYNVSTV